MKEGHIQIAGALTVDTAARERRLSWYVSEVRERAVDHARLPG